MAGSLRSLGVDLEAGEPLVGSERRQRSGEDPWIGERIASELVKSYGFKMDEAGDWSWSLENIGTAFKEDPFWTTLDYLTLAVPVVKWGSALARVERGASLAGRAYRGGEFAGRAPRSSMGRALGHVVGEERAAAVEFDTAMPSAFDRATGRMFRSTVSAVDDADELSQWATRYGANPMEQREIGAAVFRARRLEEAVTAGQAGALTHGWARMGLDDTQQETAHRLLQTERGQINPADVATLPQGADEHLMRTKDFLVSVHEELADLGLLGPGAAAKNYDAYMPRLGAEYERMRAGTGEPLFGRTGGGITGTGPEAEARSRLRARQLTEAEWMANPAEKIFDPAAGVYHVAKAAQLAASQRYAQNLARSAVSMSADDAFEALHAFSGAGVPPVALAGMAEQTVDAGRALGLGGPLEDLGARLGLGTGRIGPEQRRIRKLYEDMRTTGADFAHAEDRAEFVRRAGLHGDVDALYARAGVPGYLDRIDPALRNRFIDPHVARDVAGLMSWERKNADFTSRLYNGVLALFKETKTADNPATWARNWLGNIVFQSFVLGAPTSAGVPLRGLREMRRGADSATYLRFLETGLGKTGFDQETRDAFLRAFDGVTKWDQSPSAVAKLVRKVPYVGETAAAEAVARGATRLAEWYGNIDEAWKLDTWMRRTDQLVGAGHAQADAERLATLDVVKFMQTFNQRSQFGEAVSRVVPFGSFSTEALRVWKNVLVEKPHLAFFWTNFFDVATQAAGAMAGLSYDELEAARESLPNYVRGRKLMALPVAVDGKPRFLDLSYIIPMGNLADMATGEKMFFREAFDPLSNPAIGAAAATMGTDPFSGREIAPRFLERQLGVEIESPTVRRGLGLAEYMTAMLLPPLAPGGYALTNLLEVARGQRSPVSGQELEESALSTVAANLAGLRTYTPRVESDLQNVMFEQKNRDQRMSMAWNDYEWATANGNAEKMESAKRRIVSIREEGGHTDAADYFAKGVDRHAPGAFSNLSKKQIEEAMRRARGYALDDRDRAVQGELVKRMQKKSTAKKKEKTK